MDDLERAVGRLEGKIEQGFNDLCERIDRLQAGVFGQNGLEPRLRDIEGEIREIKTRAITKAGIIATVISVMTAFVAWFSRFLNGK